MTNDNSRIGTHHQLKRLAARPEPIRDPKLFRTVVSRGTRFGSTVLKCTYVILEDSPGVLRIGTSVHRGFMAVERNRLKRLVREAARLELSSLSPALEKHGKSVAAIIGFKSSRLAIHAVTLAQVRRDLASFASNVASTLS